jgi:hypothetical protein
MGQFQTVNSVEIPQSLPRIVYSGKAQNQMTGKTIVFCSAVLEKFGSSTK